MQLHLHLGAHHCASAHLWQHLAENGELLKSHQVKVAPKPVTASNFFSMAEKTGEPADLASLVGVRGHLKEVKRLVILVPDMLGEASDALGKDRPYPEASERLKHLAPLARKFDLSFSLSLRFPASWAMSLLAGFVEEDPAQDVNGALEALNIENCLWSGLLIAPLLEDFACPTTVWRQEDYPCMWRDVVQAVTGIFNKEDLEGTIERVNSGMSFEGMKLFQRYVQENKPKSKKALQKVISEFREQFPSVPLRPAEGTWTAETRTTMQFLYEDDWYLIERLEHLKALKPIGRPEKFDPFAA